MNASKLVVCSLVLLVASITTARAEKDVDFAKDVFPILQARCVGCHNADDTEAGLAMHTHAAMLKGGENGLALTPGEPNSSRMILMITGKMEPRMPPEDEDPLTEKQIAVLTEWIENGATGPDGDMPIKQTLRTPKITPSDHIKAPITAVAISPDGSVRAEARFGVVEIILEGNSQTQIAKQPGKVNSLQFSADGSQILVASGLTGAYGRAAIYSTFDGELVKEFAGHRDTLYSAVFSPDQKTIATAGYDRSILLWDIETGDQIREFTGHNGAVFDLAFSPDGTVLVSACADETVKVWNVATGKRLDTLSQPEGEVFAVDITADGKFILAGSADNRLRVWRLLSKDSPRINPIVATRFVDESPIVNFQVTPNSQAVIALSQSGNIKVIRTADWNQEAALQPLPDTGSDLRVLPSGDEVLVALMNGTTATRKLPRISSAKSVSHSSVAPLYLDLPESTKYVEADLRKAQTLGGNTPLHSPARGRNHRRHRSTSGIRFVSMASQRG